jgi:Leucine-rich repeat (LRR) protein
MRLLSTISLFVFCFFYAFDGISQALLRPCNPQCSVYQGVIDDVKKAAQAQDFPFAIRSLYLAASYAAERCSMDCTEDINMRIDTIFSTIAEKNREAEELNEKNKDLIHTITKQKQEAYDLNQKYEKIIKNMYFFDDENKRFALVTAKDRKFGFVDADGEQLLGGFKFDKAQPFDDNGFAKVEIYDIPSKIYNKYLLDTLGYTYLLAVSLKDLTPNTEALDLSGQGLTIIPENIKQYQNLKILILSDNQISQLNKDIFTGLTNLQYLNLSNNLINQLERNIFQGLMNLQYLDISNNHISNLDQYIFLGRKNLKYLFLDHNKLKQLDRDIFSWLTNLQYLDISNNYISDLNKYIFTRCKNLKYLFLDHNELKELDKDIFELLTNLRFLNISYNHINELDKNIFSKLSNLVRLGLARNPLHKFDINTLQQLSNMQKMALWKTPLSESKNDIEVLQKSLPNCKIYFEHDYDISE